MKKLKFVLFVLLLTFLSKSLISQLNDPPSIMYLLSLANVCDFVCTYQVIPVSMPMNGNNEYNLKSEYSPVHQFTPYFVQYDYLATVYLYGPSQYNSSRYDTWNTGPGSNGPWPLWVEGTYLGGPTKSGNAPFGSIGKGIYKIICMYGSTTDTAWFELDAGYYYSGSFKLVPDVSVYGGSSAIPGLTYQFYKPSGSLGPWQAVSLVGNFVKDYDAYSNLTPHVLGQDYRNKNFGNFTYSTSNNFYTVIPQDARLDCNNSGLPIEDHDYSLDNANRENGVLSLNLTVNKSISTSRPDSNWLTYCQMEVPNPYCITILSGANFSLSNNVYITLADAPGWFKTCSAWNSQQPAFIMTDKTGGKITLNSGSKIIINNDTKLLLEANSYFTANGPSEIRIYPGGVYSNQGAIVTGPEKTKVHHMPGGPYTYLTNNSITPYSNLYTDIYLDSAVLQIPDNTTLVLDSSSSITMSPGSTMQFGQNSKIVLQNGAFISANNATFMSNAPNNLWDGIYLSGISNDTIKNCIIENAANGININNKSSAGLNQPSTEISNCTFVDSSSTVLNDGIYVSNSYNVLIRDNSFNSTAAVEGFASAILIQYCPSGNFDILDNTISNVINGISVIQSSPYIARNTINGQQNDGTGIILDNSNGTLKYNTVNYFSKAIVTYYSSAYLFRNNLNNSANNIIDLYQSSAPILRPINSGSTLTWLGGNNFLNGTQNAPSGYGIGLNSGSFPSLDSGFNNIVLNGANYMAGDLFSNLLPATYNYWGDRPPVDNKFAVTNGSVIDTPDYDGTTLPSIKGYELNDIGFGLFDTVYTGSSNNPGADNLYSQAYENEVSGNYLSAINLYKQVVANYKTSNLVPAAVSRIINCLEKKFSKSGDFSELQNYMIQIRNNNNLPYIVRELAEDFIIKSMVRQNLYQYSINNYDTMYVHNQGNHKGTHAMINKLCLMSMFQDTSRNHLNAQGNLNQYKLSLLSLLTGKQLTPLHVNKNSDLPKEFKLYQNYPNPFNPTTKIKYDLPKEGIVKLKIYDIIGREIYSFEEYKIPGSYELTFDGSRYASGVYFYRIEVGSFVNVKKMVLVK